MCVSIAGAGLAGTLFSACSSIRVIESAVDDRYIKVPMSSFAPEEKLKIIRTGKKSYDILLIKKSESDFLALLMKCSHQDTALTAGRKGLICGMHGSMFDLEGDVTVGPATQPLRKFPVNVNDGILLIEIV